MDQIARRYSRNRTLKQPWPLVLPLLPGEILSSWLCRSALVLGTDPIRFTAALWPGSRTWSRDFDRYPIVKQIQSLAASSDLLFAEIENATLEGWIRSWMGDVPLPRGACPWLVPIGARGIARSHFLHFCPHCWREDEQPYYRKSWRLSWYVACERHGELLRDRCPACLNSVSPHRLLLGVANIAMCDHCGSDLRDASSGQAAPARVLAFQATATNALTYGEARWWQWPLETQGWFLTAKFWLSLLRQGVRDASSPTASLLREFTENLDLKYVKGRFDEFPADARANLLAVIEAIAEIGSDAALHIANRSPLTQNLCAPWVRCVPMAGQWVRQLPVRPARHGKALYSRRRSQYGLGHPRPRHEVELMYRRLLRDARTAK